MFLSVLTPSIRPQHLHITQKCLENQTYQRFEWITEIGLRNRGNTLAQDMNKMLRRARGEKIVMLQDCIQIDRDALERIDKLPNDFFTFPVGKVSEFGHDPLWDWRTIESRELAPEYWEADYAAAPRQAFFEIGGYDETFDEGWSWDNVEVAYRAKVAGYRFYVDRNIRGIALDHDAQEPHPWRTTRPQNDKRARLTKERADQGDYRRSYLFTP